jgi:hypothetical protein
MQNIGGPFSMREDTLYLVQAQAEEKVCKAEHSGLYPGRTNKDPVTEFELLLLAAHEDNVASTEKRKEARLSRPSPVSISNATLLTPSRWLRACTARPQTALKEREQGYAMKNNRVRRLKGSNHILIKVRAHGYSSHHLG